jgi:hypothetical protein
MGWSKNLETGDWTLESILVLYRLKILGDARPYNLLFEHPRNDYFHSTP